MEDNNPIDFHSELNERINGIKATGTKLKKSEEDKIFKLLEDVKEMYAMASLRKLSLMFDEDDRKNGSDRLNMTMEELAFKKAMDKMHGYLDVLGSKNKVLRYAGNKTPNTEKKMSSTPLVPTKQSGGIEKDYCKKLEEEKKKLKIGRSIYPKMKAISEMESRPKKVSKQIKKTQEKSFSKQFISKNAKNISQVETDDYGSTDQRNELFSPDNSVSNIKTIMIFKNQKNSTNKLENYTTSMCSDHFQSKLAERDSQQPSNPINSIENRYAERKAFPIEKNTIDLDKISPFPLANTIFHTCAPKKKQNVVEDGSINDGDIKLVHDQNHFLILNGNGQKDKEEDGTSFEAARTEFKNQVKRNIGLFQRRTTPYKNDFNENLLSDIAKTHVHHVEDIYISTAATFEELLARKKPVRGVRSRLTSRMNVTKLLSFEASPTRFEFLTSYRLGITGDRDIKKLRNLGYGREEIILIPKIQLPKV